MKTILVRLNISQEEYDAIVMDIYLRWCMDFAINYTNDLQKVMANQPIYSYFISEFTKCENEFLEVMRIYEGASHIKPRDAMATFYKCAISIFSRYPKNLIINAKKPITISYDAAAN